METRCQPHVCQGHRLTYLVPDLEGPQGEPGKKGMDQEHWKKQRKQERTGSTGLLSP